MSTKQVFNNLSIFEVSGKDTFTFFNNQMLSEFNHCDRVMYSAICNPKGRIAFTLLIFPHENGVKIAVNTDLSDNFYHYVTMRKFRMDLLITATNDSVVCHHLENLTPDLQSLSAETTTNTSSEDKSEAFWQFIFANNLPWITDKTTERFIPQHLNLDLNNIINFEKGCYPGQEIVARLHFIGKVKKRMTLIESPHALDHLAGDKAFIDELQQEVEFCSPVIKLNNLWLVQVLAQFKDQPPKP